MRQLRLAKIGFKHLFTVPIRRRRTAEDEIQTKNVPINKEIIKTMEISRVQEPSQRPNWKCFKYEDIFKATNGFDPENLVGRGGYAEVYKGVLKNGQSIAVKKLTSASSDEDKAKEFLTELGTMGHVCHPNVSALLGCCIDNGLHLIFEYSSKGSVASVLHNENSTVTMDWKTRYKIAIGTARGLLYLHKGCQRRIIHRDIKASNVLLTADFEPQISDFGLAKWLPPQWTHHSVIPIEGTPGYLAPEYFMYGIVDEKTDVFAFGVLLLEIICGRRALDGSHQSLLSWAKPRLNEGNIEMLVDGRLGGDYDVQQLRRLVFTASLCIGSSATCRPSMSEALELLENGEKIPERWKMPDTAEQEDEFYSFYDFECESPTYTSLDPI